MIIEQISNPKRKSNKEILSIHCKNCGKEFKTYRLRQIFCSKMCHKVYYKCHVCAKTCNKSVMERFLCTEKFKNYSNIKGLQYLKCPTCGKFFKMNRPRQKYCSKKCTLNYRKPCKICGNFCKFGRVYCSDNCRNIGFKLRLKKQEESKIDVTSIKQIIPIIDDFECVRCKKFIRLFPDQRHHIIPRKYNGIDDDINRISLCDKCHNFVEEKTEEWIQSEKYYSIALLKTMIINDGF